MRETYRLKKRIRAIQIAEFDDGLDSEHFVWSEIRVKIQEGFEDKEVRASPGDWVVWDMDSHRAGVPVAVMSDFAFKNKYEPDTEPQP